MLYQILVNPVVKQVCANSAETEYVRKLRHLHKQILGKLGSLNIKIKRFLPI